MCDLLSLTSCRATGLALSLCQLMAEQAQGRGLGAGEGQGSVWGGWWAGVGEGEVGGGLVSVE